MTRFQIVALLTFLLISCKEEQPSTAGLYDSKTTFFETLYNSDTLSIEIITDIDAIYKNKLISEKLYQPAMFRAYNNGDEIFNHEIKVRPRGITRKRICDFPPLMLKIPDKLLEELGFIETDNIKLLAYCKETSLYKSYVMKEYLNYKFCNILTNYSFIVKLVNITFKDEKENYPDMEQVGFLIEPVDEMAMRIGCELLPEDTKVNTIHKENYKNLVVFQYMIGNSDWNFARRHNIRLVSCDPKFGPVPVPYDFDYSGLVNAEYAEPHPSLPIDSVTERLFQWRGGLDEDFSETYNLFFSKRDSFYNVLNELPYVNDQTKIEIAKYIDEFYDNIISENIMKEEIRKARSKS